MKPAHILAVLVLVLVGYVVGVKYPSLPYLSALTSKI